MMTASKPSTTIRWLLLLIIVIASAALRLAYNANTLIVDPVRADAAYNLVYAHNLLDHGTFSKDRDAPPAPDAYWAPGYPLFLATVIKSSELLEVDTYNTILLSQVLLGVGAIYLCFLLGTMFLPGYWPLLPTLFMALSPHSVSTASYILTETLFGFVLVLSLYTLGKAIINPGRLRWLLAGSCFAMCYLVNPVSLFLAPILAVPLLLRNQSQSPDTGQHNKLAHVLLLVVPVVIIAATWAARTAIVVPEGQSTASNRLLTNLVVGIYPDYHEKWRASILKPDEDIVVPGEGVDESYHTYFQELLANFSKNPLQMVAWYAIQKPILLWSWDIRTGFGDIYIYRVEYSLYHTSGIAIASYTLMKSLHFWLLAGALLGGGYIFTEYRNKSAIPALLYLTALYISAVYVISQSESRYSIPLRPELYLCATFFLWRTSAWFDRLRSPDKPTPPSSQE